MRQPRFVESPVPRISTEMRGWERTNYPLKSLKTKTAPENPEPFGGEYRPRSQAGRTDDLLRFFQNKNGPGNPEPFSGEYRPRSQAGTNR